MKFLIVVLFTALAAASQLSFPIHRMIQLERKNTAYGSQANTGELRLASLSSILNLDEDARLKADHYTALVMLNDLSELVIKELVDGREVGGIVVVIPVTKDKEVIEKCQQNEVYMLSRSFACPVYFIEEEPSVMEVYNKLQVKSAMLSPNNIYTMSVRFPANKKPVAIPEIRTIESVVEGFKEGVPVSSLPTILVTASYDAFSVVPSLTHGAADGASSTVALLEILRLFRRLYNAQKTVGVTNLMFLLSSGSHLDYEGYRQWMIRSPPELFESIRFVLCLDDLASSSDLTLRVSRHAANDELQHLYASFEAVAKEMNVHLEVVTETVNIMEEHRSYPHERFALRRLTAGTLSSHAESHPRYLSGSLFDTADEKVLARNVQLVAEALARYMFDLSNNGLIFTNAMAVDESYLSHWMDVMTTTPRHTLFLKKDDALVKALEAEMRLSASQTRVIDTEVDLKEEIKVFGDNEGDVAVFISKTPLFDVYTFLLVIVYMAVLYIVVSVMHNGSDLVSREIRYFLLTTFGIGAKPKEN
ncbi:hypothetical protein WA588_000744 [Blastocystis sp. NMH]